MSNFEAATAAMIEAASLFLTELRAVMVLEGVPRHPCAQAVCWEKVP